MARVSLKGVSKIYPGQNGRDITAVDELNLEIRDREFVVLAGPSRSGISNIIRMIAGLDDVSRGNILIGDHPVNDLLANERDIALVSQNYAPYPGMSVRANLAFGLKRRRIPGAEIKKRVLEAARILGLEKLLERPAESLPDEQRQRVAIARALALQPKVFLFDEPLLNLEPKVRADMRHEIVKLHQRSQVTMVYATHDPIEAMALGGRIVVINNGAIQQDGTGQALFEEPANVLVAGFFGAPPMNFVPGSLKLDREWLLFSEVGEGTIELRLPASAFPGARNFGAELVVLGIRPEDIEVITITSIKEKQPNCFPAIIERIEPIGRVALLYVQTGAHSLVCRSDHPIDSREAGHRSQFKVNLTRVCLFDPTSGRRIT